MTEGLLDTSVVVSLGSLLDAGAALPDRAHLSVVSLAELAAGPLLAQTPSEAARRQQRLLETQRAFPAALPVDEACATAYARVAEATRTAGRSHRPRFADLLIAASGMAYGLTLYTRNREDVAHLSELVELAEP